MDVKDGVAEALSSKSMGQTAQSDVGVVAHAKDNFVPRVKSCVNSLKEVIVKARERDRGFRARDTHRAAKCQWC